MFLLFLCRKNETYDDDSSHIFFREKNKIRVDPLRKTLIVVDDGTNIVCSEHIKFKENAAMKYGADLKILINKLEERGVINKSRAKALRRLATKLDQPTSKAIRSLLVKAIVDILTEVINSR